MSTEFADVAPASGQNLAVIVDGVEIYLQPVINIATGSAWAYEALARFGGPAEPAADEALETAHREGYGHALEAALLIAALARRADLPDGTRLALNVSPDA